MSVFFIAKIGNINIRVKCFIRKGLQNTMIVVCLQPLFYLVRVTKSVRKPGQGRR